MTKEHAAEVILENEPWMDCIHCNNGYSGYGVEDDDNYELCNCCYGSGKLLRMEYEEACQLTGAPLPKTGKDVYFQNQQHLRSRMRLRSSKRLR